MSNRIARLLPVFQGGVETPWYLAGGAPVPLAAWQFKGASSEAASLLDLVNSNNLTKVGAPIWNTNTGWQGNGSGYLASEITPTTNNFTFLARYTGLDDAFDGLFGCIDANYRFEMHCATGGNIQAQSGSTGSYLPIYQASGVFGIANHTAYVDGVPQTPWGGSDGTVTQPFWLMCYNDVGTPTFPLGADDYILVAAAWNAVLTTPQVLAVSTAMAAL